MELLEILKNLSIRSLVLGVAIITKIITESNIPMIIVMIAEPNPIEFVKTKKLNKKSSDKDSANANLSRVVFET